ncbi:uncharacterized protein LOC102806558 [Saccoglossus kowalevskii]|uniref:Uncharacterized protein LOC102806558 n=1 Tax=Saccoglossus kowalevskii TaxID=10224 RepID=A0ABM0MH30_SACKO|nr:PREDICTED: uncharacterized protein LOC102806558 [Saccoglossus kowalevskii]
MSALCYSVLTVAVQQCTEYKSAKSSTVYIDVGANRGDTLQVFYNTLSADLSNNPYVELPYDYEPSKWKVFAFEADEIHSDELHQLQKKFHFKLYSGTAAWVDDLGVMLYLDRSAKTNGYWGTSISGTKRNLNDTHPVKVQSLDFSAWLREHVTNDDFVVLKMNIEGAEFAVLDKMLRDETFCLIDQLFIFYHVNAAFQKKNPLANDMPGRVTRKAREPFCGVQILFQSEH